MRLFFTCGKWQSPSCGRSSVPQEAQERRPPFVLKRQDEISVVFISFFYIQLIRCTEYVAFVITCRRMEMERRTTRSALKRKCTSTIQIAFKSAHNCVKKTISSATCMAHISPMCASAGLRLQSGGRCPSIPRIMRHNKLK